MDEWKEREVVKALQALFNIPQHWHFDLVKVKIANNILRNIAREGVLILKDSGSMDRGEYVSIYKKVFVRFLDGKEYFIAEITLTDDDYEHLPKSVVLQD